MIHAVIAHASGQAGLAKLLFGATAPDAIIRALAVGRVTLDRNGGFRVEGHNEPRAPDALQREAVQR
ncbi:MAG TPA: hypothetical protein VII40_16155 [Xanthobacteraceae bacterium]